MSRPTVNARARASRAASAAAAPVCKPHAAEVMAETRLEEAALGRRERRATATKRRDPGLERRPRRVAATPARVPPQGLSFEFLFALGAGPLDSDLRDGRRRRKRLALQLFLAVGAHPLRCRLRSRSRRRRGDLAPCARPASPDRRAVRFALVPVIPAPIRRLGCRMPTLLSQARGRAVANPALEAQNEGVPVRTRASGRGSGLGRPDRRTLGLRKFARLLALRSPLSHVLRVRHQVRRVCFPSPGRTSR